MHFCTRLARKHITALQITSLGIVPDKQQSQRRRPHVISHDKSMNDQETSSKGSSTTTRKGRKLSKKGFSFFNITDAQFGVNNFNAFLHYQL